MKLSEENGKLVGHKNLKQRIEYLVKLKKENTRLQEVIYDLIFLFLISYYFVSNLSYTSFVFQENEKLRTEMSLLQNSSGFPQIDMT